MISIWNRMRKEEESKYKAQEGVYVVDFLRQRFEMLVRGVRKYSYVGTKVEKSVEALLR